MNKYRIVERDFTLWSGKFIRKEYIVEKYTFLKNGFGLMDWVKVTDFWHREDAENWIKKKLCEEQIDDMRLAEWEAEQAKYPKESPKRVVHRYTTESDSILEPWGVGKITSRLDQRTGSADR